MIMHYNGFKIFEDDNMMVVDEIKEVPKTWKERWFSIPWEPWEATGIVVTYKPDTDIIVDEKKHALYMHPMVAAELRKLEDASNKLS